MKIGLVSAILEDYDFKNHDETVVAVVHEATNVFSAEPENGPEAQVSPATVAAETGTPASETELDPPAACVAGTSKYLTENAIKP